MWHMFHLPACDSIHLPVSQSKKPAGRVMQTPIKVLPDEAGPAAAGVCSQQCQAGLARGPDASLTPCCQFTNQQAFALSQTTHITCQDQSAHRAMD
jgi:hypothetical protein